MHDLSLCGLRTQSELPLPELPPWRGNDQVSITITMVDRNEIPDGWDRVTPFLWYGSKGHCVLDIPSIATYTIADGRHIAVSPRGTAHASEVRLFLYGPVLSVLALQRNLLPLRAACIAANQTAIVIAGQSGVGKSTLAAGLAKRGYALLSDAVTLVRLDENARPSALPVFSEARLWRDSLSALGIPVEGLMPNRLGQEKYRYNIAQPFSRSAIPIECILLMSDRRLTEPKTATLLSTELAARRLVGLVDNFRLMRRLDRDIELHRVSEEFVKAVPVFELPPCPRLGRLSEFIDTVQQVLS